MTEEEKRMRRTLARVTEAMACEPDDDDDLVEAVRLLVRERDEARAELDHMRQGYDRVRADRDYHCDRAIAAVAERDALALLPGLAWRCDCGAVLLVLRG